MKKVKIPKGKGKYRQIYIPSRRQRVILRQHKNYLDWLYLRLGIPECVHGFVYGKSAVTNAAMHVGYKYTLSFDLFSFFDTIRRFHLKRYVPRSVLKDTLVEGAPRQGLCTSPVLSNIAFIPLDRSIMRECSQRGVMYTRYADDITLSCNNKEILERTFRRIRRWIINQKFYIADGKTKFQSSKGGRRIITGVAVDDKVYAPRKFRRRMRAAEHQGNTTSLEGMEQWAALNMPFNQVTLRAIQVKGQNLFEASMANKVSRTHTLKGAVAGVRQKVKNEVARSLV